MRVAAALLLLLLLTMAAASQDVSDPSSPSQLQPSSHECTGDTPVARVCVLHNVLLRGTSVLYLLPDPLLGAFSVRGGTSEQLEQQLAEKLTVSIALYHNWTNWAGQSHLFTPILVPLSTAAALLGGAAPDSGGGGGGGGALGDVVMYQMVAHWDSYHYAAEALPNIHMLACEHLGHCDYADRDFHLAPGGAQALPTPLPRDMADALACVTRHPPIATHERGGAAPLLVRRLVVGIGPRCRGPEPYCAPAGAERAPIAGASMAAIVRSYHECLGLNPAVDAHAPHQPRALLVNRRGARQIAAHSVARAAAYATAAHGVRLQAVNVDGMSARDQATAYKWTPALIEGGGAASPNLMFLQPGAAIALAYPLGFLGQSKYELGLLRDLNAAGRNLSVVHAAEVPVSHLLWQEVLKEPGGPSEWAVLSAQERVAVLRAGRCPDELRSKCENLGFYFVALELPPAFLDAALGGMLKLSGVWG